MTAFKASLRLLGSSAPGNSPSARGMVVDVTSTVSAVCVYVCVCELFLDVNVQMHKHYRCLRYTFQLAESWRSGE
eukprot:1158048-Pelagomonas_calceolata.AAC.18